MSNYSGPSFEYRTAGSDKAVAWGYPPGVSIVDLVPEDMRAFIHPHWNKFPPVNPMWHYLLVNQILSITELYENCVTTVYLFQLRKTGPHLHLSGNRFHYRYIADRNGNLSKKKTNNSFIIFFRQRTGSASLF